MMRVATVTMSAVMVLVLLSSVVLQWRKETQSPLLSAQT